MGQKQSVENLGLRREKDLITLSPGYELTLSHYTTFKHKYEGLKLWEGAIVLLRYMLQNKEKFLKKKVMDLGAGMGIIGIALAKFFECEVTISDYIPEVLELAKENVLFNKDYPVQPKVMHLDWEDSGTHPSSKFDLIIGCELVYSITNCSGLASLIKKLLKPSTTMLMIIPTCRANRDEFMEVLAKIADFEIQEIPLENESLLTSPMPGKEDIFYPIRELKFMLVQIEFKA